MRPYRSLTAFSLTLLASAPLAAQVTPPPGWGWHHDQRGMSPDSAGWAFTSMAPGFHLTTSASGATLFPTGMVIEGRRAAEARVILFPGSGSGAYGLGVTNLDAPQQWVGMLVRRDGSVAVARVQRGGEELIGAWQPAEAVVRPDSTGYATNVLRMQVGADDVVFLANGKPIGSMPRSLLPARSGVAFRMGPALNMHVTTFDLITPMAPVPAKRTP
ncbi:MAG TPA: hypothetical protein PLJ23_03585 [Gemmatimonadales bacterium]|nr:hypothetical protein [Gemmatimonadales bacterium]